MTPFLPLPLCCLQSRPRHPFSLFSASVLPVLSAWLAFGQLCLTLHYRPSCLLPLAFLLLITLLVAFQRQHFYNSSPPRWQALSAFFPFAIALSYSPTVFASLSRPLCPSTFWLRWHLAILASWLLLPSLTSVHKGKGHFMAVSASIQHFVWLCSTH